MISLAICIPTYKRAAMLDHLVTTIFNLEIPREILDKIIIVIADNDMELSAKQLIEKKKPTENIFKILYFSYPSKGLSNIRNELLKRAFELDVDFISFLDDDEYISKNWLIELLFSIRLNNSDAVMGPVIAQTKIPTVDYIEYWFKRKEYENNVSMNQMATGNILFKTASLRKWDVWFDRRFNKSGGEDFYFGKQILKKGAKIVWSAQAIAYETIPEKRATVNWLMRRKFRGATTYTYILTLEKEYLLLAKKIILSVVYIFTGIVFLVFLFFPYKKKIWGLLAISEGLGGIAGAFAIRYSEYN